MTSLSLIISFIIFFLIFFPIDDSKTLAREINRLINEPIVGSILSENGQKTYENNFSKEIVVKKYVEFFERMLK